MAKQNNNAEILELQSIISTMKMELEELKLQVSETKKKGGKPKVEKVAKLYPKLNGHYFQLNTEIIPEIELNQLKEKLNGLLNNSDYKSEIEKIQLGRAILNNFHEKGEIYFWSPNQEKLMFGPIRSGMKNSTQEQLFNIPLNYLIDLGNGVEEKTGRINLENKLNFESFKIIEVETTKIKKLTEKLNKLSQK
jgi:hypothetical protein